MTKSIDIVIAPEHTNVVLVDILRFTSTMTTALANGAKSVETYADEETPKKLKAEKNYIICGEYKGMDIDGYDFNNSPVSMTKENVAGRNLAFCTTNGTYTRSVIYDYGTILAGSFLNFSALCNRLSNDGQSITIVCSGSARRPATEDIIFAGQVADYLIKNSGFTYMEESVSIALNLYNLAKNNPKEFVLKSAPGKKIIIESNPRYAEDFEFVFQTDLFDIVPEETSALKFEARK